MTKCGCVCSHLAGDLGGPLGSLYLQDVRVELHAFPQDLCPQVLTVLLLFETQRTHTSNSLLQKDGMSVCVCVRDWERERNRRRDYDISTSFSI